MGDSGLTTLLINGRKVKVDDGFRNLTPEQQQATVDEIAASMGGAQPADAPEQSWGATALDMGKSLIAGVGRGAAGLVGLPGTLGDLAGQGVRTGYEFATGNEAPQNFFFGYDEPSPISASTLQSGLSTLTGGASDYQAQTTPGKYAGTVGEFIPGAVAAGLTGGGSTVPQMLNTTMRYGVLPGVASEAAGQATEGSAVEPYARVAAALAAPAIPAIGARVISPMAGSISPQRQDLIETLMAEGVKPTAGQRTGSKALQIAESELGGATARNIADDQARAFTEAAMARTGNRGLATPENMTALNSRLKKGFNDISARNAIRSDPQFGNDIGKVLQEYERVLPTAQREIVTNMADDIIGVAAKNNGSIPGDVYQSTRSRLTKMAQAARNSDPEYASALRGLRNSLDEAMSRSVSPSDAAEWSRLRREYGNMKVLERAAVGAGDSAAEGMISPAKLRQATTTGRHGSYARGEGDLDALARAGQIMSPLANSNTASRLAVRGIMSVPTVAGAALGGHTGDIASALAGAAIGSAVPAAAGKLLMTRPVQAYLANQAAPNMSMIDPRTFAVIQSIMSNQEAR